MFTLLPTYGSPFEMLSTFVGIVYQLAGENIALGQTTPEQVVEAWMNSEGHRENILNQSYTHIGVGYVSDGTIGHNNLLVDKLRLKGRYS